MMLEKRKEYIDQILRDLKSLEERVTAVKDNDSLPFSFFKESFDNTQEISRALHKLEFLQIDDMRREMERLVHVLSEVESRETRETVPPPSPEPPVESPIEPPAQSTIILPEYKNPKSTEPHHPSMNVETMRTEAETLPREEPPRLASLPQEREAVSAPLSVGELKRSLSLNDRFLFQRELFQNDRQEMDRTMAELARMNSYEVVESYLRESRSWDFESPTVNDFLLFIRKGFE